MITRYDTFTGILQGLQLTEPQYTYGNQKTNIGAITALRHQLFQTLMCVAVSMRGSVCAVLTQLQFVSAQSAQNYHITNCSALFLP